VLAGRRPRRVRPAAYPVRGIPGHSDPLKIFRRLPAERPCLGARQVCG
jgi:hypothetical protein